VPVSLYDKKGKGLAVLKMYNQPFLNSPVVRIVDAVNKIL
jgi:hypothetical protein